MLFHCLGNPGALLSYKAALGGLNVKDLGQYNELVLQWGPMVPFDLALASACLLSGPNL